MDDPRTHAQTLYNQRVACRITGSVANFSDYRIDSGCWTQLSRESRKLLEWAMSECGV